MSAPVITQEFLRWKDAIEAEATVLHYIAYFFGLG